MSIIEDAIHKNRRTRQQTEAQQPGVVKKRAQRDADRGRAAAEITPDMRVRPVAVSVDAEECRQRRILVGAADGKKDGGALAAYRILRTRLLHRARTKGWSTIAVTSAGQSDGKTLTAINLVLSMAREKSRDVVLLDLDMRKPNVFRSLGVESRYEIRSYLESGDHGRDMFLCVGGENLLIAGNRSPAENASELLASSRFEDLIHTLKRGTVDPIILIDLPPLLLTDDVFVVAPRVDAILLVASEGFTAKANLQKSLELLKEFPLAGVVVNRADETSSSYGYGYGYEHGEQIDAT
jgi:protein-tyrosine kinase